MKTIETSVPVRLNTKDLETDLKQVDNQATTTLEHDEGRTQTNIDEQGNEQVEMFSPKIIITTNSANPDADFTAVVTAHNPNKTDEEKTKEDKKAQQDKEPAIETINVRLDALEARVTALEGA